MIKLKLSKKLLIWEIVSVVFVILVGSAFHFIFALSGYNSVVGAISAVNESTWEHTKLAFFPILIFSLIQYPFIKKEVKNYFSLKTKEIYLAVILIPVVFYTYSGVMSNHYLWMDILTFVLAVVAAKLLAYIHLYNKFKENKILPIILIVILGLFYIFATFFPPKIQLFLDTPTGNYGIVIKDANLAKPCQSCESSDASSSFSQINQKNTEVKNNPTEKESGKTNNNSSVLPPDYLSQMESCQNNGGKVEKKFKDMGLWTAISSWRCVCANGKTVFGDENLKCNIWFTLIEDNVVCTQEVKLCSDGSYVGRTGPNCEFSPCP